jgi:hypothetical protein
MATITRAQFPNLVMAAKSIRKIFLDEMGDHQYIFEKFYNVETADGSYTTDYSAAGFTLPVKRNDNDPVTYDTPQAVGEVRYNYAEFALGFRTAKNMIRDEKHGFIAKLSKNLAKVMKYRAEVEAAAVFNNAFAAFGAGHWGTVTIGSGSTTVPLSYIAAGVTFDGLSIFNTAHVVKRGTTYSNTGAIDLGYTGFAAMNTSFRKTPTEGNLIMPGEIAYLIVPVELELRGEELLNSSYKPFTANNEENIIKKRGIGLCPWPQLTSATRWFGLGQKGYHAFNWFWRQGIEFDQETEFQTKSVLSDANMRLACGASDWRYSYGGNP